MIRVRFVGAALLLAAACAPQQKVKSARQASADAKAAQQQGATAQPRAAGTPTAPPAVSKPPPISEKAAPQPAPTPVAPVAPPAPAPMKTVEAPPPPAPPPPVRKAEVPPPPPPVPAPPKQAQVEPPAKVAPLPAAPPKLPPPATAALPKPAPVSEPVPKLGPADLAPARAGSGPAAPAGSRGGLCVERPSDAVSASTRELFPSMDSSGGPRIVALDANEHAAVAVLAQFRAGAIDDPPGKAGLTALTARLMAEGGTESLDSRELRAALFPASARISARVDKELTTFGTRLHKDHLGKVLPIFSEVLRKPRWDDKEFARLRDAAVDDVTRRLRQTDDENLGKAALEELLFAGHPYGRLTEGHERDLKSITLQDVKAQAARIFTADRLTVGVAGGYPEGLGQDLARGLGQLPARGAATVAIPAQKTRSLHYRIIEKPGQATAISIGAPWTLTRAQPDYVAMSIARSAFGEHRQFHGRLMRRLREQRGLNYGDYSYIEHFEQEGGAASQAQTGRARHLQEFSIWLRPVQNENALFALRAALYQLHRTLAEEPFTDEEVERTKSFLAGYLLQFDETDARKLGYALDDQAMGLHRVPGFLDEWRRRLPAVTPAEVNSAWKRWVDPCSLQIVLVTPDAQAMKRALLSGAATPIQYQRDGQGMSAEKPAEVLAEDKLIERFSFGTPAEADIDIVPVADLFQ